jgi:hypothetical protein
MKKTYPLINGWDLSRILELAPAMDAPIRVLDFQGIPCSVYGSPLLHSGHSRYGYKEPDRKYRDPLRGD